MAFSVQNRYAKQARVSHPAAPPQPLESQPDRSAAPGPGAAGHVTSFDCPCVGLDPVLVKRSCSTVLHAREKLKTSDTPAGKHACRHHVWLPLPEPEPLPLQEPQPPPLCLPPLLASALCLLRNAWLFFQVVCLCLSRSWLGK